jgi:hypothetical protein
MSEGEPGAVTAVEASADRNVVVVLHPERPLVLTGAEPAGGLIEVAVADPPPSWTDLLAAVRPIVPDGAWPLGPSRNAPGLWLHTVQARNTSVPHGYRWVDAPDPRWPEAVQRAVATTLDEDTDRVPTHPLRVPWMRRGWWEEMAAWVDARLAEADRHRTGEVETKEYWGISAVARIPATGGAVWLKAVPPIFAREPAILALLGERLPGRVPAVLAAAEEAGGGAYFLTEDAGTVPDAVDDADPPLLAALIADLQVRTLGLLPRLTAAGCADRSPGRLATELARMAEEGIELDLLDADQRAALKNSLPELTDRLLALSASPLPNVLVHGDFHAWNVTRKPGWSGNDAVVIDWTDAAIGPAGVDLTTLLSATADEAARRRVTQAYASVWAHHLALPLADVEAAVAATEVAAQVVQALAYDEILRAIEPATHSALSGAMATRLRALLEAM